jgi:hypothetical protein
VEEAKHALAEKKRLAKEIRKQEIEEAKRKEEEDARIMLRREEEERQKAWEEHMQKTELARQQSVRACHDIGEEARHVSWQDKNRVAEEANKSQAAQFQVAQQAGMLPFEQNKRKRGQGSSSYSREPYKIPRKVSMFDYLKGPPPGSDNFSSDA